MSLLLALVGTSLAALALRRSPRRLAAAAASPSWRPRRPAGAGSAPWQPTPDGEPAVAAVQGDVPGDGTDVLADFREVTDNHVRATVDLADEVASR